MKKREVKPTLDLRYPSSPLCDCNLSAAIRVVESSRKPSKGKLFYCCPHQRCRFFGWCVPKIATWAPDGFPVRYPNEGDDSLIYADGREYNEIEEEACYEDEVSMASVSRSHGARNVNNYQLQWIFCAALFLIVVLLLLKK